jgi:hypothetical protein
MAIRLLSNENVNGDIDVNHSQNAITYLAVTNANTGVAANARAQVVGESAQVDIIATSAGYTGVTGWADSGIISTDSGASGGLKLNSQAGGIQFQINTSTEVVVDTSGNLGVNTESPDAKLEVVGEAIVGDGSQGVKLSYSSGNTSGIIDTADSANLLEFRVENDETMWLDTARTVHILGASASTSNSLQLSYNSTSGVANIGAISGGGATSLVFQTADSGAQTVLTLDSSKQSNFSGNILMGNTVTNPASGFADQTGIGLKYSTTDPELQVSSDSVAMQLGRTSTGGEGQILTLRKAGTVIHSFSTNAISIGTDATFTGEVNVPSGKISVLGGNNLTISGTAADHCGLSFATNAILPCTVSVTNTNTVDLGASSEKFKDFYYAGDMSGGTATFSGDVEFDKNVWQDIGSTGGYIMRPHGADYMTSAGAHTGAIEIRIPTGGAARYDMVKFVIDIFDYEGKESVTVFVGGYIYEGIGNDTWVNCTAQVIASTTTQNYNVRFGDNGSVHCVWIGDTDTTWNYPQIIVRDFYGGYDTNIEQYLGAWDITYVTSFSAVDTLLSNNFPMSSGGTDDAYWTGSGNNIYNDNTANVGIRTTTPEAYLSIGRNATKTNTGTSEVMHIGTSSEASNYATLQVYTKGAAAAADRQWMFQTIEQGVANAGTISFQPSGGNVGIGTTSSTATLQVTGDIKIGSGAGSGTDSNNMSIQVSNATYGDTANLGLLVRNNGTNGEFAQIGFGYSESKCPVVIGSVTTSGSSATKGDFIIGTRTTTTGSDAPTERMRITSDGNAIFTEDVTVTRASNTTNSMFFADTTGGGSGSAGFGSSSATGPFLVGNTNQDGTARGAYGGSRMLFNAGGFTFQFSDETSGARTFDTLMTIQGSTGNVGIGTTTFASTTNLQLKMGDMGSGVVGEIWDAVDNADNSRLIICGGGTGTPQFSMRHYSAAYGFDIWMDTSSPWDIFFDGRGVSQGFRWRNYTNNDGGEITLMDLDGNSGTGTLTVKGDLVAYGSPSDKRLKENIHPIENALEKVSQLNGVTFDWKEKEDAILEIKEDIGFIAQDVQKVVPELVRENEDGKLSLRDKGIVPILVEAIKELKAEIEELKKNR